MTDMRPLKLIGVGRTLVPSPTDFNTYVGEDAELYFTGTSIRVFNGARAGGFKFLSTGLDTFALTDAEKEEMRLALGIVVTGMAGIQGQTGLRGLQGLPGQNGADGKNGERGLPGADGRQGDRGEPGLQGLKGDRGPQGPAVDPTNLANLLVQAFSVLGPYLATAQPTDPWQIWNNGGVLCITTPAA